MYEAVPKAKKTGAVVTQSCLSSYLQTLYTRLARFFSQIYMKNYKIILVACYFALS